MKIYNTMTRQKEEFITIKPNEVSMYTCGPTVYNFAHIGNLRTYIHEDILQKTLEYLGYNVKRVMNITDVGHLESDSDDGEDKMLKGALRENKTVWEIADFYTQSFFNDCAKLNIKKPAVLGKATDYIDDYIEFIKTLEEKDFTYFENGNVYFDISKVDNYTKLSRMNLDELQTATRENVTEDTNKRNPQDFVLWFTKSKFENQAMKWESPWGIGYPGWHIECSVISLKNLGNQMDIHCGGVDHIPVHHTNEMVQTESYTGESWVNYWWHSEFLLDKDGKMSKSKGDFLTVSLLEKKGFNPLSYRYYILNSHYRKQLGFSYDSLKQAENAYDKLKNRVSVVKNNIEDGVAGDADKYKKLFKEYISDDLNTANAITVLFDVLKAEDINNKQKIELVQDFEKVLSIGLLDEESQQETPAEIMNLIEQRMQARKDKDFALADQIRDKISEKGYVIEETRQGTKVKKA